jgi:hypothetical protein
MTGELAEYAIGSTDFADHRLASSMVVFGCLTDTWTDTVQRISPIIDWPPPWSFSVA